MASKPVKRPDTHEIHHNLSEEPRKTDHSDHSSCPNSGNSSPNHPMKVNHAAKDACSKTDYSKSGAGHVDRVSKTDAKLTSKQDQVSKTDAKLTSKQDQVSKNDATLTTKQDQVSLTDAKLSSKQDQVSKTDAKLTSKQDQVSKIDAMLTSNQDQVSKTDAKLTNEQDQVSKTDAKLTSKQASKPQKSVLPNRNNADCNAQRQSPSTRMPSSTDPPNTSPAVPTGIAKGLSTHTKTNNQGQGSGIGANSRSDSLESTSATIRPHTGGDIRWDAINMVSRGNPLNLSHFRLLKRLGYGDIGSVYLVELKGTKAYFAMKVMDKAALASRNKLLRAQTEREILGLLDHPFLPTLYSYFETDKFNCLVMEFCSGGDLHSLRQKQPNKRFTEEAARFYASEVLLALEYLHMLGIVYRDLKPENLLVRDGGHIMLSDFDLSLRCSVNPTLVKSSSAHVSNSGGGGGGGDSGVVLDDEQAMQGCIQPSTFFPRILPSRKNRKAKSDFGLLVGGRLPELMAEPTNVRSMSFVGTHEYLAPEIIRGEGHGSAVDWWTFGIFLYELLHGTTPFKGAGYKATLFNVVGQPLRFPETPQVSSVARDLIRGLLVKEPHKRIAYKRGATEIKQHPFFEGVNWALVRSATPPHVPEPIDFSQYASKENAHPAEKKTADIGGDKNTTDSSYVDFEYF